LKRSNLKFRTFYKNYWCIMITNIRRDFQNIRKRIMHRICNTFTETFLRVARECISTKMVTVRNSDRPWFNGQLRREIIKRDRIRKTAKKYSKQSDIDKYSLLRTVTILVEMHSLATLRNVSVKVLHISSTSSESESIAFQSTVSSLLAIFSLSWNDLVEI
jgi:hypothetical protein